jgi:NAD(P)-dependent dehydrogenase (short-subunit alcohol dehydrogenase family)
MQEIKETMTSHHPIKRAVIIGASGGIGRAFVQHIADMPSCEHVLALSRSSAEFNSPRVSTGQIDITDEDSVASAATKARELEPFDAIIVATGFLHGQEINPERSLRALNRNGLEANFLVNTVGPALVAKHFLALMPRGERSVFAALSARVGSISDNRLGGWYSYRASKSALNMILKGLAIEHGRRQKDHIILGLHPGTVDTELSKPFQKNVPDGKLFTAEYSADKLLEFIMSVTPDASGKVFDWAGKQILA